MRNLLALIGALVVGFGGGRPDLGLGQEHRAPGAPRGGPRGGRPIPAPPPAPGVRGPGLRPAAPPGLKNREPPTAAGCPFPLAAVSYLRGSPMELIESRSIFSPAPGFIRRGGFEWT